MTRAKAIEAALKKISDGNTMEGQTAFTLLDIIQQHAKIARESLSRTK